MAVRRWLGPAGVVIVAGAGMALGAGSRVPRLRDTGCCTSRSGDSSVPAPTLVAGRSSLTPSATGVGAATGGTLFLDRLCVSGASFRTPSSVPSWKTERCRPRARVASFCLCSRAMLKVKMQDTHAGVHTCLEKFEYRGRTVWSPPAREVR